MMRKEIHMFNFKKTRVGYEFEIAFEEDRIEKCLIVAPSKDTSYKQIELYIMRSAHAMYSNEMGLYEWEDECSHKFDDQLDAFSYFMKRLCNCEVIKILN